MAEDPTSKITALMEQFPNRVEDIIATKDQLYNETLAFEMKCWTSWYPDTI